MTGLLVRGCRIDDSGPLDVRIRGDRVVDIGPGLRRDDEEVVDGAGGALIPGLHDHHLHLFALAAALVSVPCGPADVRDAAGLAAALRAAAARGPVRAVGYHESVAGALDRDNLDAMVPDMPVRVLHRSGGVWFLNSAALDAFALADSADRAVERETDGRATGRLLRGDHLLRRDTELPDLAAAGRLLASVGVTGVTDATPHLEPPQVDGLRSAHAGGALPQAPLLLGAALEDPASAGVPWKVLVDEVGGLDPAALTAEVGRARRAGRPVALHCTSRAETVLAAVAVRDGHGTGDRLEHAGVLPPELDAPLARDGVTVVTQPHFVAERGDDYLADVDPADHPLLYRCGTLLADGVRVAVGTDAPFGSADPWGAIAAAVTRRTRRGTVLGAAERVTAARALQMFLGTPLDPGGPPRRVEPGAAADLCLLSVPLSEALTEPRSDHVAATVIAGRVVHRVS